MSNPFLNNLTISDYELLKNYSKERNVEMTVENLISSHRSIVDELNRTSRKEFKDVVKAAWDKAEKAAMDNTWIKKEDLKKMTIEDIVKFYCSEDYIQ
ncbi:MAG: hypothetical protein PF450_04535 [Bacteroidales bacterium]|jgi:hypothetical protein|nr:hypothetical protein [Bacteroidales bacterium]